MVSWTERLWDDCPCDHSPSPPTSLPLTRVAGATALPNPRGPVYIVVYVKGPQAGIKIPRRNINNLRYADDTTSMAESEEELKSLLMSVKQESKKADLKLSIQKTKIMASSPITSWQIDGGKVEAVTYFIFLGSKITVYGDCSHKIKRPCSLEGKLWKI